jgi:hypothetical protein
MKINIKVFDMLDSLARLHYISDVEWAAASQIRRPTIPELRRISRVNLTAADAPGIKRACTLEKILQLHSGLSIKIGHTILNTALKKYLETEADQDIRLQLLILILKNATKEKKDEAERMLKSVLKSIE